MGPEVDEVAIGEDGVGFAEFVVDEAHDEGQVMLPAIAHVLNLTAIERTLLVLALRLHDSQPPPRGPIQSRYFRLFYHQRL